ncbi:hypothetical protein JKJ11_18220 [Vibrio sp. SCSIO 43133]|uniref:hypothetical protein n=1 Tax=Vibrio sp. SCSIO 43133 TaxID=2802577 RepID=UPI0020751A59|nr:hypothetical protein [Vibrio sp. SCSIO 43133]USE03352.1 hypothetical protein JKJ11_18220 [Vibrio sp. SCSIO 43133]
MLNNYIHSYALFTDGELLSRLDRASDQLEELIAQSLDCQDANEAKTLRGKLFEKQEEIRVYIEALEEFGYDYSGKTYLN